MKPKASTGFRRRLLMAAATVIGLTPAAFAQAQQTFFVLNNQNDPNFNQLLGINNGNVIVGYFGDGMGTPNNGYVLVPPNHYTLDFNILNFTLPNGANTASQVQAIGINNATALAGATPFPDIVGFYTDQATPPASHGFLDSFGTQSTIDDPAGLPPNVTTPVQNLLGVNNALRAAGFWTDNAGHEHGFVAEINTATTPVSARFTELTPAKVSADLGVNAVATQTSGIANGSGTNLVCGFWTDANGNNNGFQVFFNTATHSFNTVQRFTANPAQIPNVASLSPLGCNDRGVVVGTYTTTPATNATVHGFVFDGNDWHTYDAAGSSQQAAMGGVKGTTINGINNNAGINNNGIGTVVGFFSDGMHVNGFVDFAPVQ